MKNYFPQGWGEGGWKIHLGSYMDETTDFTQNDLKLFNLWAIIDSVKHAG